MRRVLYGPHSSGKSLLAASAHAVVMVGPNIYISASSGTAEWQHVEPRIVIDPPKPEQGHDWM